MKSIGYKRVIEGEASSHLMDIGMPIVYMEEGKDPRPVGVVTEEGKVMTFASLVWILEGTTVII